MARPLRKTAATSLKSTSPSVEVGAGMEALAKVLIALAVTVGFSPSSAIAQRTEERWAYCDFVPDPGLRYVTNHFVVKYDPVSWTKIKEKWKAIVRKSGFVGRFAECDIQGPADREPNVYYPAGTSVNVGGRVEKGGVPFMQKIVLFPGLAKDWFVDTTPEALAKLGGASVTPSRPSGPGYLTIEDNGVKARTKAWEDSVLQMRREEAAMKVQTAIATAESKAKNEVLRQKMLAEMRNRGNKQ